MSFPSKVRLSAAASARDLDLILDDDEDGAVRPRDPARAAARAMLRRAMAEAGVPVRTAARPGAVVMASVPAPHWTAPVAEEWKAWIPGGAPACGEGRTASRSRAAWKCWAPEDAPTRSTLAGWADDLARMMSEGRRCAGFAADPAWLPDCLALTADHMLALRPLDAAGFRAVLRETCGGGATARLTDEEAALLTPRLLRLALRPGKGADACEAKLRELLARAAAAERPVPPSPRQEPSLDRLHGMDAAVAWGTGVARDLAAYGRGELAWADVERGCVLSGPPGVGKTLFARALARTCGVPLVTGSHAAWQGTGSGHQGNLLRAMAATFGEARVKAPAILFIDEIDSFPDRRAPDGNNGHYTFQVVNALLAEIDGVAGRDGVVLLAACNHPGALDPALVRSGRLERHIHVGPPDRVALGRILREHLGPELAGEDLSGAALFAAGSSSADCERHVRGARRRARAVRRPMVLADLLDELGGDTPPFPGDLWTSAVHEAGHAVAVHALRPGRLETVSVRGTADGLGLTSALLADSALLRADDVADRLVILLAGRAAEEDLLGSASSGSGGQVSSDLAKATGLAVAAATSLGLDRPGGLTWTGMPEPHLMAARLALDPGLAARVRSRLDDAYAAARRLLRPRKSAVIMLAATLLHRRVLDGPEAEAVIADAYTPGARR